MKYRWRTWMRHHAPGPVTRLFAKGRDDCGAHEWYNHDDRVDHCYHCLVGVRQREHQ